MRRISQWDANRKGDAMDGQGALWAAVAAISVALINMIGSVLIRWIQAKYARNDMCRDATIAAINSNRPPTVTPPQPTPPQQT